MAKGFAKPQPRENSGSSSPSSIPALLELIDLTGAIITIDAMGTQHAIAGQIREKKADYVLALKGNHPTLLAQIKHWFNQARVKDFEGVDLSYDQQIETGHHRRERRQVWAIPVSAFGQLHQETTLKRSLRQKVKRAAMNNDYTMQILNCFCQA